MLKTGTKLNTIKQKDYLIFYI